jgi:SpoVK/Ycf46/Vps4 family AAA+-type ATPase
MDHDARRTHLEDVQSILLAIRDTKRAAIPPSTHSSSSSSSHPTTAAPSFDGRLLGTLGLANVQIQTNLTAALLDTTDTTTRQHLEHLLHQHNDMFSFEFPPENFVEITRKMVPANDIVNKGQNKLDPSAIAQTYRQKLTSGMVHRHNNKDTLTKNKVLFDCALGTSTVPVPPPPPRPLHVPQRSNHMNSGGGGGATTNNNNNNNNNNRNQNAQGKYGYGLSKNLSTHHRQPGQNNNHRRTNSSSSSSSSGGNNSNYNSNNSSNNNSNYNSNNNSSNNNNNDDSNNNSNNNRLGGFKSANTLKKKGNNNKGNNNKGNNNQSGKLKRKFQPPRMLGDNNNQSNNNQNSKRTHRGNGRNNSNNNNNNNNNNEEDEDVPEQYKGIDPKLIESIENDIIGANVNVSWDDIAGLEFAKRTCQEIVVLPIISPHLFSGLRRLPKGLLLFGPPGTGKTLIGKAIASQTGATFFSISASSLTSKWIGQGEKLVRALFAVASYRQPSVIFIDEIDSLLSQRSSDENEASRRIKTEFLVQLDGAGSGVDDKILVLGATNRPQELDEAARRRFMKRLYIPLPNETARESLLRHLLKQNSHVLTDEDIGEIVIKSKGYSGSDLDGLCREAAMQPLREQMESCRGNMAGMQAIQVEDLRPIGPNDLTSAMRQVRASVSQDDLKGYVEWDKTFGSFSALETEPVADEKSP